MAAQAFIEGGRTIRVYYSGFDERYYRYSPLTVILAAGMRDAIARGFEQLEFSPGPTPWKTRWGTREGPGVEETSVYSIAVPSLVRGLARSSGLPLQLTRRAVGARTSAP